MYYTISDWNPAMDAQAQVTSPFSQKVIILTIPTPYSGSRPPNRSDPSRDNISAYMQQHN